MRHSAKDATITRRTLLLNSFITDRIRNFTISLPVFSGSESTQSIAYPNDMASQSPPIAALVIPRAASHLPTEILQKICRHLNRRALKRFRLVCKHFSYAAESFLFRRVVLNSDANSFKKITQIACHP